MHKRLHTSSSNRITQHQWLLLVVAAIALVLILALGQDDILAQTQPDIPSYWQYSTSGRMEQVITADLDRNGVEDFLVVDENDHADLISAAGKRIWNYVAPDNITSAGIVSLGNSADMRMGVVIGLPGQLILLSEDGGEIWRVPIAPLSAPSANPSDASGAPETAVADAIPVDIAEFRRNAGGQTDILVLLQSGELLIYNGEGAQIRRYTDLESAPGAAPPQMLVSDLDRDGQDEIVLAVLNPRRFGQVALIDNDRFLWDLSLSRSVTDLESVTYREDSQPLFAVSTTSGHVYLYDYLRRRHWLRTLNAPVTSLSEVHLPGQSILAAGTSSGSITAFDEQGRRLWTTHPSENTSLSVLALASAPAVINESEPVLVATVETTGGANEADAFLLNSRGQISSKISDVDARGLTQFVDSNRDLNNELLVARFATLELLGVGVGNSGNVQEWEYALNAAPASSLIVDVDGDGNDEVLIGTSDGRVHSLSNNRAINWLHDAGGEIRALAALEHADSDNYSVVVAVNNTDDVAGSGSIQLREAKGERIWEYELNAPLSALLVADVFRGGDAEIVAGTAEGLIVVLSSTGEPLWEFRVLSQPESINHLVQLRGGAHPGGDIVAAGDNQIFGLDVTDTTLPPAVLASFAADVTGLYALDGPADQELAVRLLATTADGFVHGLSARGIEMSQWGWPVAIGDELITLADIPVGPGTAQNEELIPLLLGTGDGRLLRLDVVGGIPQLSWEIEGLGNITDLLWRDQDGGGIPDIAIVGNQNGRVTLYRDVDTDSPLPTAGPLELTSTVFDLATVMRDVSQVPDLLVIGKNGLVQLFRDQENRPPLLTNPQVATDQGQYSITIDVTDVESDLIVVRLEVQDPESGAWLTQDIQQVTSGVGTLFWALSSPPASPLGLRYRFVYSDGSQSWTMTPPPGPPPSVVSPYRTVAPFVLLGVTAIGLVLVIAFARQARTPGARASRFYQKLRENPAQTLPMLEEHASTDAAQELNPHIASHARQANDEVITNLVDGLFLLPERPLSGLPIINRTLDDLLETDQPYEGLTRWKQMFYVSQTLLEAPSITELGLLYPQLEQLASELVKDGRHPHTFPMLIPVLSNLRDSGRVDLAEDRLVYLNDAGAALRQIRMQIPTLAPSLEILLVSAIVRRWSGLVSAEIEDIKGRAELAVTLKTGRLVASEHTIVALEIINNGRSAAEDIVAVLDENPAYTIHTGTQHIASLPPGRAREVRFDITPQVADRFRVSLILQYSDRNAKDRKIAFGDMVNLLPPLREFNRIPNPYTPGTPLRQDSLLFFGREDLFEFVAENAGQRSYRNVLILVGQRRTGKTSALLRLEDRLPSHLIPVYIDCQSLGVVPGMPALLEELAWYIADTMSRRGIEVNVPDLAKWEKDPTRLFQREFLPHVSSLLPAGSTLLLVFDEFEAFESLVSEGILPSTFFTYLRHLMQHSDQLNFIFVGTRRLEEMTTDYWSVLFNIALYRKIGFLSAEAATRLITEPVSPNLIYDDLALDKILRVTAGHPYFLQLVCYTLVKHANAQHNGYVTISNVNAAVDEMLSLGEVHFAYIWQRSGPAERAILAAIAHLMDPAQPFHPEELIQKLEPYDIQLDPAEITSALNSLVDRDILHEVTEEATSLFEMKLGLVSLWVAKNKSLSKLYAADKARTNGRHQGEPLQK